MGNLDAGLTRHWFQISYYGGFELECTLTIQWMYGIEKKAPRSRGFAINDSDNSVGGTLRNNIR